MQLIKLYLSASDVFLFTSAILENQQRMFMFQVHSSGSELWYMRIESQY